MPNNYKTMLNEITQRHLNLSSRHEALTSEFEDLQGEYDDLDGDHQNLEEDYSAVSEALAGLTEEHDALTVTLNETLKEYDCLLMQYLIITGSAQADSIMSFF